LPQGAADQHRLDDEGSQELQLGLMGMGIAALGVQLAHGTDLTKNGGILGTSAAALTFAVPAARLLGTERGRSRLGSRIKVGCAVCAGRCFCMYS
jgi:hypothetical protein